MMGLYKYYTLIQSNYIGRSKVYYNNPFRLRRERGSYYSSRKLSLQLRSLYRPYEGSDFSFVRHLVA